MSDDAPAYAGFLGSWELIPESCSYEQGDPPRAGMYRIFARGGRLVLGVEWTATDGRSDAVELEGIPDGVPRPFAGGDAIDSLAIEIVSPRDLRARGLWEGRELMVAQHQLDDTHQAMRVTQLLRFVDGTRLANVSVYRRQGAV